MKSKLFTILCVSSFFFFSVNLQAQFDITFQVDMCEQIGLGTFNPATQALYVTGGNANQTGNFADCGLAMTDADMDGVYDLTQSYPDGYQIIYKFYIGVPGDASTGNCNGATPPGYEPDLPAPCGFGNFNDRTFTVAGGGATLPVVCYGSCVACTTCACDLILTAGGVSCNALTSGTDTYDATFNFSQTTAPGAGTYTITTGSGGTITGDDPNTMTSGVITVAGINEGVGANLTIQDGADCDLLEALGPPACLPSYDITFQVDMCEQINAGTFDPATQSMYVTGGTANQTGNYADCGAAMTDADMDGIYEITQTYPDAYVINYKFYTGVPGDAGTGNCTGAVPGAYEPNLPAPCGFGNFGDRQYTVAGQNETLMVVCLGSCTACTTCNCDLILAAGTASCDAQTSGADTYSATFTYTQAAAPGAGTYTLGTTSGGTIGGDDPNTVANGTITITGITEGTDADLTVMDGLGCDLSETVASPACIPSYDITFQLNMCERIAAGLFDPATQAVYVTGGNANQSGFYGTCGVAMTDANGDGAYEVTQSYPDGYQVIYKFYIGFPGDAGTNNCDGSIAGTNPDMGYEGGLTTCAFGQFGDREYVVNGTNATVAWACFGSCDDCASCAAAIPTVGEWGLILLALMLMIFSIVAIRNSVALKPTYE